MPPIFLNFPDQRFFRVTAMRSWRIQNKAKGFASENTNFVVTGLKVDLSRDCPQLGKEQSDFLPEEVASPSNQDKSISKTGSKKGRDGFTFFSFSKQFKSSICPFKDELGRQRAVFGKGFVNTNAICVAPTALKISIRIPVSVVFSKSVVQTTGSCAWSPSVQNNNKKKAF